MNQLDIVVRDNILNYHPGEWIEGKATWLLERDVEWLEVRLLWFTQGKGDSDISVEDTLRLEHPALQDNRGFRFALPQAPYSFSGKLISLVWAIEIVAANIKEAARLEFTLSPDGHEIELGTATAHLMPGEIAAQQRAQSMLQKIAVQRAQKAQKGNDPFNSSDKPDAWR